MAQVACVAYQSRRHIGTSVHVWAAHAGRTLPIGDESGGLAWAAWQIVVVSVGGGIGVLMLCMLCALCIYLRHHSPVAVGPAADDPEPGNGYKATKVRWGGA